MSWNFQICATALTLQHVLSSVRDGPNNLWKNHVSFQSQRFSSLHRLLRNYMSELSRPQRVLCIRPLIAYLVLCWLQMWYLFFFLQMSAHNIGQHCLFFEKPQKVLMSICSWFGIFLLRIEQFYQYKNRNHVSRNLLHGIFIPLLLGYAILEISVTPWLTLSEGYAKMSSILQVDILDSARNFQRYLSFRILHSWHMQE